MPRIQTRATTLNYQWDGPESGPVVMLSHSLAADLNMWTPQVAPLAAAGYRVLRYDSRGHGRSAVPPGPYTIEQLADDAVDLMDSMDLTGAHFCGLSMGGMVGQSLGARHADRLLSLALCSTSAYMPPRELWQERIEFVSTKGMAAVVDATIDRWFTKAGQARLPDEVQKIRDVYIQTSVEGFCACCAAIRDMDQRDAIRVITTPTMILAGEYDEGTPVSAAKFIHERIAASRLVVTADAAHLQNIEQSEVFTKSLLEFLEENRGTSI